MKKIAAVLVASDSRSSGDRSDAVIPAATEALAALEYDLVETAVVPDDRKMIAQKLLDWCSREDIWLVLTSGGTGLSPRDNTPEATLDVIEREAPGIAEYIRQQSLAITNRAALSRAVAGTRDRTLIINLPGSPKGVRETIHFLEPILHHALEVLRGDASECAR